MGGGEGDRERKEDAEAAEPRARIDANGDVASLDEVLDCLRNPRRRRILYYLRRHEIVELEDLATEIAAVETGVAPARIHDDDRARVVTSLVHTHLPKLADLQFVEYDQRSGTIRCSEPQPPLGRIIRLFRDIDEATPR